MNIVLLLPPSYEPYHRNLHLTCSFDFLPRTSTIYSIVYRSFISFLKLQTNTTVQVLALCSPNPVFPRETGLKSQRNLEQDEQMEPQNTSYNTRTLPLRCRRPWTKALTPPWKLRLMCSRFFPSLTLSYRLPQLSTLSFPLLITPATLALLTTIDVPQLPPSHRHVLLLCPRCGSRICHSTGASRPYLLVRSPCRGYKAGIQEQNLSRVYREPFEWSIRVCLPWARHCGGIQSTATSRQRTEPCWSSSSSSPWISPR